MVKSKKIRLLLVLITLSSVTLIISVSVIIQDPIISFVLKQSGYLEPNGFNKIEEDLRISEEVTTPVMVYRNQERKTDLYYIFIHGFSPKAHRHETIDRMAASLCDATGMNVLVPKIPSFFLKNATPEIISNELAKIYTSAYRKYPGRYRAFAACLASTMLLTGLKKVENASMPEKIFLYGSLFDGTFLLKKLEEQGAEVDFVVKLVMASAYGNYKDKEQKLIHKALMATEPGPTDESKMKLILGKELYENMSVFHFTKKDIRGLDPKISDSIEKYSNSKFYILNPRGDRIIPLGEGKRLAKELKNKGAKVNFLGTGLFDHTVNRATPMGLFGEFKYLYKFFQELFEGDI